MVDIDDGSRSSSRGALADRWSEGDASLHLEELDLEPIAPFRRAADVLGATEAVELVGAHLRLSGTIAIGQHRRLSDFMNHHEGLMELMDATVLRRNGDPTKVQTPSIWVNPLEVTLIGQQVPVDRSPSREFTQTKTPHGLIVVTPGHTLTGEIYLNPQAELAAFIESSYPQYIAMTDARLRSLADRRVISRYAFALLNRRQIVAATERHPGMVVGRSVL